MTLYVPADWWPEATRRDIPYWGDAVPFTSRPDGWMMHVPVMYGSLWSVFAGLKSPDRRFCHLWIAQDGRAEQYGPFSRISWAAMAANPRFYSIEFEGMPETPLTPAQIATAARFHVWSGTADHVAMAPAEAGISAHYLGGAAWGGHSCPDPSPGGQGPRSHQRAAILAAARALRGDDVTPAELEQIIDGTARRTVDYLTGAHALQEVHVPTSKGLMVLTDALSGMWASLEQIKTGSPVTLTGAQVNGVASAVASEIVANLGTSIAADVAAELAKRLAS